MADTGTSTKDAVSDYERRAERFTEPVKLAGFWGGNSKSVVLKFVVDRQQGAAVRGDDDSKAIAALKNAASVEAKRQGVEIDQSALETAVRALLPKAKVAPATKVRIEVDAAPSAEQQLRSE